jgi:hypothetical protein
MIQHGNRQQDNGLLCLAEPPALVEGLDGSDSEEQEPAAL